jgi:flagellar biosynthesis protein FliR
VRIDLSFLPALGAAFLLVFARIGTMLMLLPGLGEQNISARMRLTFAPILAATLLPLHRNAYHIDPTALGPVLVMLVEEILIGAMLGVTARLTIRRLKSGARSSLSNSALVSSPPSIRPRASRA